MSIMNPKSSTAETTEDRKLPDRISADHTLLRETIMEIDGLAHLGADWNDEGAPKVDELCILRARTFVRDCARLTREKAEICAPSVYPTIDGGVKLYWLVKTHQVSLAFLPGSRSIEFVEKLGGADPTRVALTEHEAKPISHLHVM